MNTHKLWLQQLQDQYNKRISDGHLTEDELNKKIFMNTPEKSKQSTKSLHEAIAEIQGQNISEIMAIRMLNKLPGGKKAIDAIQKVGDVASSVASVVPGGNLVGSAIDAVSAGVDTMQGDYKDAASRGIGAAAGLIPGGKLATKAGKFAKVAKGATKLAASYDPEGDSIMEEIAYQMIEEFEQNLGRRLLPEEIEEFIENNFDIIEEKANQVTAHAIPGDKNTGVGATPPQEPTSKPLPPLKAKASTIGKKTSGTEY